MSTLIAGGDAVLVFNRFEKCEAAKDFNFASLVSINTEWLAV